MYNKTWYKNTFFHVSKKYKLVVCSPPKSGTTTWQRIDGRITILKRSVLVKTGSKIIELTLYVTNAVRIYAALCVNNFVKIQLLFLNQEALLF